MIQQEKNDQEKIPFYVSTQDIIWFKTDDISECKKAKKALELKVTAIEEGRYQPSTIENELRIRLADVLSPNNEEDYSAAWCGFTGDYYAYNPVYVYSPDERPQWIADEIFVPRFKDQRFTEAKYLFFTGKGENETANKSIRLFCSIINQTMNRIGDKSIIYEKLKIKTIPRELPNYAFYVGKKRSVSTCIIDLWNEPLKLDWKTGGPADYIFVLDNEHFAEYAKKKFKSDWDCEEAKEEQIDNFIKKWTSGPEH